MTGRLPVTEPLMAETGFLWAPAVITLADWLCACGIGPHLPEGASFTTLEIKGNFLGTVREGGSIFAARRGRCTAAAPPTCGTWR
jgi:acyl-coenzyme A thioesterase PaaI-like protein